MVKATWIVLFTSLRGREKCCIYFFRTTDKWPVIPVRVVLKSECCYSFLLVCLLIYCIDIDIYILGLSGGEV